MGRELISEDFRMPVVGTGNRMPNGALRTGTGGVVALTNFVVKQRDLVVESLGLGDHDHQSSTNVVVSLEVGGESAVDDCVGDFFVQGLLGTRGNTCVAGHRCAGQFTVQELHQSVELCVVHSGDLTNEV